MTAITYELIKSILDYETKWVFDLNLSDSAFDDRDFKNVAWGKTGQRVLDLVDWLPGENYCIVMDNLYSSEPLAEELLRKKRYMLGTMRKNRLPVGKPPEMVPKSKHPKPSKSCPKGSIKGSVNSKNNIALLSMMDSGLVYLIDTIHGPALLEKMIRREKLTKLELMVYKAFCDYNDFMGGVDAWDALRTGYFAIEMVGRTAKWTIRFVDGIFNMALAQAWVAHRHHHPQDAHYGRSDFMMEICEAFLDNTEDLLVPHTRHYTDTHNAATSHKYHNVVLTKQTDEFGHSVKLNCVY